LEGVTIFESSIGGLGGCPFAPGATGNIATEDLVHMLESMGIDTGIDLPKLIECAKLVQNVIGKELPSQVLKAGPVPWALKTDAHHPTIN
jgi:hydroxymethylglutaryl-CoA lyase